MRARYTTLMRSLAVLLILFVSAGRLHAQVNPEELFRQAQQAQQAGDYATAARKYQEILKTHPEVIAARANLAASLTSLGRFDEAIAQYKEALQQVPGNRDLRLNLGITYYQKGDYSAAAGEFEPLHKTEPADARIAMLLSDCYSHLDRDADAIALLSPLETADPQNLGVAWALGSALIRSGHAEEGLQRIEKVARQGHRAEAYALAADTYLKLDLSDRARSNVEEATRLNPDLPGLHTLRGAILDSSGDQEGAAAEFQKALAANPNDFEAELRLGGVLYSQRKLDEAEHHVNRALQLDPTSSLARYELARIERAQGQLEQAAQNLEKVVQDDPGWLPPHVELVALYYRLNRPEDGARQKQIVDKLRAEEQERQAKSAIISPALPSHSGHDPR